MSLNKDIIIIILLSLLLLSFCVPDLLRNYVASLLAGEWMTWQI